MPNQDKTGPAGKGAKTGGQMGKCTDAKPQQRPFDGRGQGMGRGQGRGRGLGRGPGRGVGKGNN
ncbi:MAG: DUF5320 family protein [Candidatus Kerfeldbacteria bacterium]